MTDTTFNLRDYLSPGGRYPYERLPRDMQEALARGESIVLLSVPGFVMVMGNPELAKEGRRAWYADSKFFASAFEAIRGINGSRNPTKLVKARART